MVDYDKETRTFLNRCHQPNKSKYRHAYFHIAIRGKWTNWENVFGENELHELFYCLEKDNTSQEHTHVGIHFKAGKKWKDLVTILLVRLKNFEMKDVFINEVKSHFNYIRAYHLGGGKKGLCKPGPIWIIPKNTNINSFSQHGFRLESNDNLEKRRRRNEALCSDLVEKKKPIKDFIIDNDICLSQVPQWLYTRSQISREMASQKATEPDKVNWPWKETAPKRHVYIQVGYTRFFDEMQVKLNAKIYYWNYNQCFQDSYYGQKYIVFPNFHMKNFQGAQHYDVSFFANLCCGLWTLVRKGISQILPPKNVIIILQSRFIPSVTLSEMLKTDEEWITFARYFNVVVPSSTQFEKEEMFAKFLGKVTHFQSFRHTLFLNDPDSMLQLESQLPAVDEDKTSIDSCCSPPVNCRFPPTTLNISLNSNILNIINNGPNIVSTPTVIIANKNQNQNKESDPTNSTNSLLHSNLDNIFNSNQSLLPEMNINSFGCSIPKELSSQLQMAQHCSVGQLFFPKNANIETNSDIKSRHYKEPSPTKKIYLQKDQDSFNQELLKTNFSSLLQQLVSLNTQMAQMAQLLQHHQQHNNTS